MIQVESHNIWKKISSEKYAMYLIFEYYIFTYRMIDIMIYLLYFLYKFILSHSYFDIWVRKAETKWSKNFMEFTE